MASNVVSAAWISLLDVLLMGNKTASLEAIPTMAPSSLSRLVLPLVLLGRGRVGSGGGWLPYLPWQWWGMAAGRVGRVSYLSGWGGYPTWPVGWESKLGWPAWPGWGPFKPWTEWQKSSPPFLLRSLSPFIIMLLVNFVSWKSYAYETNHKLNSVGFVHWCFVKCNL